MISDGISDDIPPQMSRHKLERCSPHKAACHPTMCDVINDVIQLNVALQKQLDDCIQTFHLGIYGRKISF